MAPDVAGSGRPRGLLYILRPIAGNLPEKSMKELILSVLTAAAFLPALAAAQATALIPRSALFGNPEKAQARVSPDGKYISFIAPREGVLNVWLAERGKLDAAKPITNDQKRGIRQHYWAYDNRHVIYAQDADGDEN